MNLSARRSIIWTTPPQSTIDEVEDYRFTLRSCSTVDMGRYWSNMRAFTDRYEQEHGQSYEQARASKEGDVSAVALNLWLKAHNYAAIMASLEGLERRMRSIEMTNGNAPPWTAAEIPAEWQTQETFETNAPFSVIGALIETANAVNPGLWLLQENDEAKKNGGVSANW